MRATLRRLVREGEVLPRATPDTVLLHLPHNAAPLLSLVLACDASGRSPFCFLTCLRVVFWEWASRSIVHWDWRFAHERFIFSFARGVSFRQVGTGGVGCLGVEVFLEGRFAWHERGWWCRLRLQRVGLRSRPPKARPGGCSIPNPSPSLPWLR